MNIALHDGFNGQTVAITVDGRDVYNQSGVRTDLTIARADAVDIDTTGPAARIEVVVNPGDLRAATQVDVTRTPYVAMDIKGGAIHFTLSAEPFRYM